MRILLNLYFCDNSREAKTATPIVCIYEHSIIVKQIKQPTSEDMVMMTKDG